MNRHVNMLEAKTQLSRLVEAVESGAEAEIVIARHGKPVARLVPIDEKPRRRRRLGLAAGKYPSLTMEDIQALDEQVAKQLEESSIFPPGGR